MMGPPPDEFSPLSLTHLCLHPPYYSHLCRCPRRDGRGEKCCEGLTCGGENDKYCVVNKASGGHDFELSGVNDIDGYEKVALKFVGLNPKVGDGSGFILRNENDITSDAFPASNPSSGGPRVNLCTCDCTAGDDGVGCVGWGGVAFKYSSLLWSEPDNPSKWAGQIQAYQATPDADLNFIGTDTRLYPGGPAIYNVACTDKSCGGLFSGVFRQANAAISCKAGLEDAEAEADNGCFKRCGNSLTYMAWLQYCEAKEEDKSLGFSGYGL